VGWQKCIRAGDRALLNRKDASGQNRTLCATATMHPASNRALCATAEMHSAGGRGLPEGEDASSPPVSVTWSQARPPTHAQKTQQRRKYGDDDHNTMPPANPRG
jgi:hypothetical protein